MSTNIAIEGLELQALSLQSGKIYRPDVSNNTYQMLCCTRGSGRITIIRMNNETMEYDLDPGKVVFITQGCRHWIENCESSELQYVILHSADFVCKDTIEGRDSRRERQDPEIVRQACSEVLWALLRPEVRNGLPRHAVRERQHA
ncbi:cupin domain-containing protein [Marinivivus vitaminiproducens]|uniref:cupin domain-containing protein n=1 Tax=Marinivivus vitaminiproducens TaxID=3035935 RepID=UPI003F9F072F